MFKTVFKMSTTTPSKPLFEWVFDILNTDFDIFYKFPKYTKCFNIFTNYTVWKHKFYRKNKCSLAKMYNRKRYKISEKYCPKRRKN